MNLLNRLKAVFDRTKWTQTSMKVLSAGQDAARAPFSQREAVVSYRSWCYAAANLNAIAVASTPLRLYVKRKSGEKSLWHTSRTRSRTKAYLSGDLRQTPSPFVLRKAAEYGDEYEVVQDNHPLLNMLGRVNPYQNGYDATVLRILYTELTGNAYLHPVIDERLGIPKELWTMPSQWVEIVPGKERFIDAYLYGASREQRKVFAPDEVIHFKRPNPNDLYYGIGKVEAAWGAIQMNAAAHDMDLSFFENKARPDYILSLKADASPEEVERLEVQIDDKLRGTRRDGRFLTTNAEVTLTPLSFPPKDLNGRNEVVEEIAAVFGVPVSMLKANDPNLASATTGYAMWRETTILPLLRMDEEVLNQVLLPMFGIEDDAFVCYDNPVASDERFELEDRRTATAGGWRTMNEARKEEGKEPIDDPMADMLLFNGAPLGGPMSIPPLEMPVPEKEPLVQEPVAPSTQPAAEEQKQNASHVWGIDPEQKADDCVSNKIRILMSEGYPQDQAVAIAISMCGKNDSKALDDIDTVPPKSVADNAKRALEVRESKPESERGMTEVGIARARDLMNRKPLSEETIRRMVAYFERHEKDKKGESWDDQGPGWQAWHGWGGDEGWSWSKRKRDEFDSARGAKSVGCSCCHEDDGDAIVPVSMKKLWNEYLDSDEMDVITKAAKGELNEFERRIALQMDAVLRKQVESVLAKLKGVSVPSKELISEVDQLLKSSRWDKDVVKVLQPYIKQSLSAGAKAGTASISQMVSGAVPDKGVLDAYIESQSTRLSRAAARSVNDTTRVKVGDLLGDGLKNGESVEQLTDRVQEWAGKKGDSQRSTRSRAVTVARTEAMRAYRSAEVEAWKSTGIVEGKTWLLAPQACPFCKAASEEFSKKAVALEDAFFKQGSVITTKDGSSMVLDYEDVHGPPLHPNCRCSLQPRLIEDYESVIREMEADLELGVWTDPNK